jgi:hypothetical protein
MVLGNLCVTYNLRMGLPLRPLEIKQLFDFAIRIYRARFVPIVGLLATMQAPMAVAVSLLLYQLTTLMRQIQPDGPGSAPQDMPNPEDLFLEHGTTWMIVIGVFTVAALFQLALLPLIHVAVSRLVACELTGEECSTREALAFAGERYWPTQVALATYLLPLLLVAMFTLLPVAGLASGGDPTAIGLAVFGSLSFIWLAAMATWAMFFRYFPALSGAVQAMEDPPLGIRGAAAEGIWYLKRSYGITARYFWRCLGLMFLLWFALGFVQRGVGQSVQLIVWLIWLPSHMPKQGGEEQLLAVMQSAQNPVVTAWSLAFTSLFGLLTPGLILCYQTLLYFDLRFRKEGLDLELLLDKHRPVGRSEPVATSPTGNVGI